MTPEWATLGCTQQVKTLLWRAATRIEQLVDLRCGAELDEPGGEACALRRLPTAFANRCSRSSRDIPGQTEQRFGRPEQ